MADTREQSQNQEQRLAWYQQAKFGLFIHWGPYSAAGVEASWPIMAPELSAAMFGTQTTIAEKEYVQLVGQFNPVDYNPDEDPRRGHDRRGGSHGRVVDHAIAGRRWRSRRG